MTTQSVAQQVILLSLLISSEILAYPVFGTKRYARSTGIPAHRIQSWAPLPMQPFQGSQPTTPNQFLAPSYYTDYPYAQEYDTEYYYPPEPAYSAYPPYPAAYYPAAVTNDNLKYGVYHSLMPYYYDARRPYYYGYDETSDPVDDLHEEMQQEEERKEREDALPIGQETWFENSGAAQEPEQESIADVNAAFLQNLILSQMYNDAQIHQSTVKQQQFGYAGYGDEGTDDWIYAENPKDEGAGYYTEDEDEDVKELKSLVKKPNANTDDRLEAVMRRREELYNAENTERRARYPTWSGSADKESMDFARVFGSQMMKKSYDQWLPAELDTINYSDRKKILPPSDPVQPAAEQVLSTPRPEVVSTTVISSTTEAPDFDPRRGQKEVPLLRPAMPARHPVFKDAMDELIREEAAHRNKSSVYDTIKKLLNMEEGLREDRDENWRPQPKKRFVTNEESLVEQLGGLKKDSA